MSPNLIFSLPISNRKTNTTHLIWSIELLQGLYELKSIYFIYWKAHWKCYGPSKVGTLAVVLTYRRPFLPTVELCAVMSTPCLSCPGWSQSLSKSQASPGGCVWRSVLKLFRELLPMCRIFILTFFIKIFILKNFDETIHPNFLSSSIYLKWRCCESHIGMPILSGKMMSKFEYSIVLSTLSVYPEEEW